MERAVHGRFQVDLGHDLPVFGAHVPDMVRALLEQATVLPPGAQAFGVPVVHPVPGAARGVRRACRKQYQRNGENCDCRDSRAAGVLLGHSGAALRSKERVQGGCATESGGEACRRNQTDFPMGSIGNDYEQLRARPADNGRIERHPSVRSVPRTNPTNPAPRGTHYGVTPLPGTRNHPVQRLNGSCADSTLVTARATTSMRLCPHGMFGVEPQPLGTQER